MDWESVRFFLAVAREGSLAGAGRILGVKHSTVLRRITSLEAELGLTLFDRHPSGHKLTDAGREMLDSAAHVDEALAVLERRLAGRDLRLAGRVRIATVGVLVPWLSQALADLRVLHPGIRVTVTISPALVNLARHETDIAIRVSGTPPESLVGRRIATLVHGIYAASSHPAASEAAPDVTASDWVTYSDGRADLPQAQWVAAHVPEERIVFRSNHTGMVAAAVVAGMGLGILPCYVGDATPGLVRLRTVTGLGQEMWILTHGDLKHTPRIRAVVDFLANDLSRRRDLMEGRVIEATSG